MFNLKLGEATDLHETKVEKLWSEKPLMYQVF